MFAEQTYEFDGRAPANIRNRNPLLGLGIGADGLKTGHTKESGYGLVGSAKQDGRRIIFVLSGLKTLEDRSQEAETIVNWAFRQFKMEKFASGGSEIGKAKVWNGKSRHVSLVLENDLNAYLTKDDVYRFDLEIELSALNRMSDIFVDIETKVDPLLIQRYPQNHVILWLI